MSLTNFIKAKAIELGFQKVGIAPANTKLNNSVYLDEWLASGNHGAMQWMERRAEERKDIYKYFSEVKSVIVVAINYFTDNINPALKFSKYAHGEDYHPVVKDKLLELLKAIQVESVQPVKGIACVDTSPIMEKLWAQQAGLGWQGKHTLLINNDYGSWIFIGELLLNIELDYDNSFNNDLCGTCTACVDACPTDALTEYKIDSKKCISYLNIEYKDAFDSIQKDQLNGWIYGCDICQQVCPWNKKLQKPTDESAFQSKPEIKDWNIADWVGLDKESFNKIFLSVDKKRFKYERLKRNISTVIKAVHNID